MNKSYAKLGCCLIGALALVGCNKEVPVGPDPSANATAKSVQGVNGGNGGLKVNTPDTDPDQHFAIQTTFQTGAAPFAIVEGPAMLTVIYATHNNPYYYAAGFYLADGVDCSTPPDPPGPLLSPYTAAVPPLAVPSGKTFCFAAPAEMLEPEGFVLVRGYHPY